MNLNPEVICLFKKHGFSVVSTLDGQGNVHCAVKGVADYDSEGKISVIDLYDGRTCANLKKDPRITLTIFDEGNFTGYSVQGKARLVPAKQIEHAMLMKWEVSILSRMSRRISKSIGAGSKSKGHFEARLPLKPKCLIEVDVENIVNLTPKFKLNT